MVKSTEIKEIERGSENQTDLVEDRDFIEQNNMTVNTNLELMEKDIEPHYREQFRLLNRDIQSGNISQKGQMYLMSVGNYERALTYLNTLNQHYKVKKHYINKTTGEKVVVEEIKTLPILDPAEHIMDSPYLRTGLYCDSSLSVGATRRKLSRTITKEYNTQEKQTLEQPQSTLFKSNYQQNNNQGYI